jgi:hypothetical protein
MERDDNEFLVGFGASVGAVADANRRSHLQRVLVAEDHRALFFFAGSSPTGENGQALSAAG